MTTYMQAPSGEVFTTENPDFHKECIKLTKVAGKAARKEYARSELRKVIAPSQTVWTNLLHASASGMSRRISLSIVEGERIRNIDVLAADAIDYTLSPKGGIVIGGCGMDMGFALVYALGCALWRKGTPEPHGKRNGEPDNNGGYALKQEWM